ncbi:MAG TPA: hypothetical protein VK327_11775 [Candidatus Paceibacterota bacterium]|nr:hypothetical protein [Candidatus Paceibacterota bacterium]
MKETAQKDLASTKKELNQKTTELTQTQETLKATTAEKDKAVETAKTQSQRATKLSEELATTKTDRDNAQAEVAQYRASNLTPDQVVSLSKNLKQTQDSVVEGQMVIKGLQKKLGKAEAELQKYRDPEAIVYLPQELKGKVVISDPKWDFVVLNVGEDQQVLKDGELLVSRNGQLVAKVKVTTVQKDRSYANVLPGWKIGEILEGDQVIPAHPAS